MLPQSTLALFQVVLAVGLPLLASEPVENGTLDIRQIASGNEIVSALIRRDVRPVVKRGDGSGGHLGDEHRPPETHSESIAHVWDDPKYGPIWRSLTPGEYSMWFTCLHQKFDQEVMRAGQQGRAHYLGSEQEMQQRWSRECLDRVVGKRQEAFGTQEHTEQKGKDDATGRELSPIGADSEYSNSKAVYQPLQAVVKTGRALVERVRMLGSQLASVMGSASRTLEKTKPVGGAWVPNARLIAPLR